MYLHLILDQSGRAFGLLLFSKDYRNEGSKSCPIVASIVRVGFVLGFRFVV